MSQERKYYERSAVPRPQKRRRSAGRVIGFAMLYSVIVIIVSVILACLIWIAANDVSRSDIGFGSDANAVTLYGRSGEKIALPIASKAEIAAALLRTCSAR